MDETHHHSMSETEAAVAEHGHDGHDAHDIAKHLKTYWAVGAILLVFTGITVGLSYVNFGTQKANVAVAMIVATIKVCFVGAVFMHLSSEKSAIYRILIFTFFFVLGLFWLTYLAWYDPIVR